MVSLRRAYCVVADSPPEAFVAQAKAKPTPCEFADSKIWNVYQGKADAILCLRPADKKGLEIPLMHKAFCDFIRDFHEPCLDAQTAKYLTLANDLCQVMPSAFPSELARRNAFEDIFVSLDKDLVSHVELPLPATVSALNVNESGAGPDVAKMIQYAGRSVVLMLEEFKNDEGDAYMQICRAYEVLCAGPMGERLVKFGNPVFLLCILGMYQMVIPNNTF